MIVYIPTFAGLGYSTQRAIRGPGGGSHQSRRGARRGHDRDGIPGDGHRPEDHTGQCQWLRPPPLSYPRHRLSKEIMINPIEIIVLESQAIWYLLNVLFFVRMCMFIQFYSVWHILLYIVSVIFTCLLDNEIYFFLI